MGGFGGKRRRNDVIVISKLKEIINKYIYMYTHIYIYTHNIRIRIHTYIHIHVHTMVHGNREAYTNANPVEGSKVYVYKPCS